MTLRRVPVHGKASGFVEVEDRASRGATVGVNLFWPDGRLVTAADFGNATIVVGGSQPTQPGGSPGGTSVTLWSLIQQIPANIQQAAALTGAGLVTRQASGNWIVRSIDVGTGRLTIADADGDAGNPTIDLAAVADAGGGALLKIVRDGYGRVTGTSAVTSGDLTPQFILTAWPDPVSALRVVVAEGGGVTARVPDVSVAGDAGKVLGISTTAALAGSPFQVQSTGELLLSSFLAEGPVFCGVNGVLVTSLISSPQWLLQVGVSLGGAPNSKILVDLKTPLLRV